MRDGLFVVLEGVDGAGTTTHTKRLADALKNRSLPVHRTREPSDGPIGVLLRQIITGRVVVPTASGAGPLGWKTMALLFAADRLDHLETEILPNLHEGITVISDRYDHSSVAYQALRGGGSDEVITWVKQLNAMARRPDVTIVLDVPAEVAALRRRLRTGGTGHDIYEIEELQIQLGGFYAEIERYFPGDRVVHVRSDRAQEDVASEILAHVDRVRAELG